MAVLEEVTDVTTRKDAIIGLELRAALKRLSTQVEMESLAAMLSIRTELECENSEVLRNVASCRAVLHRRSSEIRGSLPDRTDAVVGIVEDTAVVEPVQTEETKSSRASEDDTGTDGTRNQ